jgi:hypothetical protein
VAVVIAVMVAGAGIAIAVMGYRNLTSVRDVGSWATGLGSANPRQKRTKLTQSMSYRHRWWSLG